MVSFDFFFYYVKIIINLRIFFVKLIGWPFLKCLMASNYSLTSIYRQFPLNFFCLDLTLIYISELLILKSRGFSIDAVRRFDQLKYAFKIICSKLLKGKLLKNYLFIN